MGRVIESIEKLTQWRPAQGAAGRVRAIAIFEIGRQMRHVGFWVAVVLLFGIGLLLMGDNLLGSAVLARNAPAELAKGLILLSIPFIFGVVALASDAALRDANSGFEPILRATPQTRGESIVGRFLGLQVAAAVSFTLAASGLLAGAVAPWTEAKHIGPFLWPQIGLVWLLVGLPTMAALTTICFALAALLRSTMAVYVAVIVMLVAAVALPSMSKQLSFQMLIAAAMVEPFGLVGFIYDTREWTVAQKAVIGVPLGGLLMLNRAAVLVFSGLLLVAAAGAERRADEARARRAASDPAVAASPPIRLVPVQPVFGVATISLQFWLRLRFELKGLLLRPSLLFLTTLIVLLAASNLWSANSFNGTPSLPATRVMAEALRSWFTLLALMVAAFYAGEVVWRERDRKVSDLIDATPTPDVVFLAAKTVAVVCVVLVLGLACVAAAIGVQVAKGYGDGRPDLYLSLLIWPVMQQMAFMVVVALAAAALSPHRFVAWAVVAGLFGFSLFGNLRGFAHPLFDFTLVPDAPLSEMNPSGDGGAARTWISLYWLLWSGLVLMVTRLFWPRGQRASWRAGLALAKSRLSGREGVLAGVLVAATVATGVWIFVNTVVWNGFTTDRAAEAWAARFERATAPLLWAPEPAVIDTRMTVTLEPRRPALRAEGRMVLENRTGKPLTRMHIDMPSSVTKWWFKIDGADEAARRDDVMTLAFKQPLPPGGRAVMQFRTSIVPHGFSASGGQTAVVRNGTFVRSDAFLPSIGINPASYLTDPAARRRQGLADNPPRLEPGDPRARTRNYVRADWATTDITVVTDADQTPVAPGRQVTDTVRDGRRTVRFVSDRPILNWFSIQSARYAVRRARHGQVEIAVYFHPGHGTNVDRMVSALKGGLDVYEREFGPYTLPYLRIVEFPAYGDYAQAFAGTIPFSENAGFIADERGGKGWDYVSNITLHELAHQWWAHQVVGGEARGARLLSEGLAEYSSTLAMGRLHGLGAANRALSLSQSGYNEGRSGRRDVEPALVRENGETYVTYNRANIAFAQARQIMGEAALNRALRGFLADHAFKGAPYPTSADLMARMRAETTPARWKRIAPFFQDTGEIGRPFYELAKNTGLDRPTFTTLEEALKAPPTKAPKAPR